jgi:hypothetical protein
MKDDTLPVQSVLKLGTANILYISITHCVCLEAMKGTLSIQVPIIDSPILSD